MLWDGKKIEELLKRNGISQSNLSKELGISRQTVSSWINAGVTPRGSHLLALCRVLGTNPNALFNIDPNSVISVPLHRTYRKKKITDAMKEEATLLAEQYKLFFKAAGDPGIVPVMRVEDLSDEAAKKMASMLRELSAVPKDHPVDYTHAFFLLNKLNIIVVFRRFPSELASYALYSRIYGHRVIFVNTKTNVLDLIFQLLHETVHAVRDENDSYNDSSELFCDSVSNYIQFPDAYVDWVIETITQQNSDGAIVNILKHFCEKNGHSMYGLVKMLKQKKLCEHLEHGGADTNLKKKFPALEDILFGNDLREYIETLSHLSPRFVKLMRSFMASCSVRKFAELMGLESTVDANDVRQELMRVRIE